ncbi:MAG TPA: TolC family protein [Planctomycetes bacterium]|nr:TolC family protein [Planctomycetota bacterium]
MRLLRSRAGRWVLPLAAVWIAAGCGTSYVEEEIEIKRLARPDLAALGQHAAFAENEGATTPVPSTLDAWLRYGLTHNAGLRSSYQAWRAALERVPQVIALPEPKFSYSQFVERVQTRTGAQEQKFSLSQAFPWFGKLEARGRVAARAAEKLWWDLEAAAFAVDQEIRDAFFEYVYLRQVIDITNENLVLLKRLEPVAQRRVQGGASENELLRLQVEIGKLENELETLQTFRKPLSSRLRAAMNWRGEDILPWPDAPKHVEGKLRTEGLQQALLESNPRLRAIREQIHQAEERIELAKLSGYPDLGFGATYIATDEAISPNVGGSGDDPLSFTLSFTLPIWRQKYNAEVREAEARKRSAATQLVQAENDLRAKLDQALYKLDDALRQRDLYQLSLIPRARQALEVTQVAYQAGRATLTDYIDAQRVYLGFERAYDRARADLEQARARIRALTGGIMP